MLSLISENDFKTDVSAILASGYVMSRFYNSDNLAYHIHNRHHILWGMYSLSHHIPDKERQISNKL